MDPHHFMSNSFLRIFIPLLIFQISCVHVLAQPNSPESIDTAKNASAYKLQFQRWGDFGSYHVGMKISANSTSLQPATWYINGGWDTTYALDTIFTLQIPALFPVFLRGYIHPLHPTSPLLNIKKWENVGEEIPISQSAATQLIALAQHGMVNINETNYMYSPLVKPFRIGSLGFYTSNSYVASVIHWANESGASVPFPANGNYPGFDGPYIPRPVFEER